MPHELHLIRAGRFIRSGPEGSLDLETGAAVLRSLAEALVSRSVDKAILDVRRMRIVPPATYTQLGHLARAFREAGFGARHRLAVVVSPDRYDKADFFAMCAANRGWNAYAFDSFEEAFEWLTEEEAVETGG